MSEQERLERLERDLDLALAEIDRLKSAEAIRDCVRRVCRGIDRIDEDLLRSAFHPDATVDMGKIYQGGADAWIASALTHQASQSQRQHMPGSISVRIDGEEAFAETYELDRHKTPMGDEVKDLILAARTFDRFVRRDGEWRIIERTKVLDWARAISADDGIYANSPLETGADDKTDAAYRLFS